MAKNRQYIRNKGGQDGFRGNPEKRGEGEFTGEFADEFNRQSREAGDDDETLVDIVEVKEQAQDFFEKNQTLVLGALVGLVLLLGGYAAYKFGYQAPREKESLDAIQQAQYQFERDSFALALANPGAGAEGFLDIADNYSGTKVGNLANYYAGISYLNIGNYDGAIAHLNDYSANDDVTPITKAGALGDAYAEKGDMDKAKSSYQKAVNSDNNLLTPYYLNKLAVLSMSNGDNATAVSSFQRIADDYPQSAEAKEAGKYISLLKAS